MKAKIMVVDDDAQVRGLIATILESNDYEPIAKGSAAQLREAFAEPAPEVILLDLKLPGTAWSCSRKSRSNGPTRKSSC